MTMNLSQLLQLRTSIKQSDNKVISRDVVLAILDSHISALGGQDESSIIQQYNEPVEGTQRVRESTADHMAHRKAAQQVMRDHQAGMMSKRTS